MGSIRHSSRSPTVEDREELRAQPTQRGGAALCGDALVLLVDVDDALGVTLQLVAECSLVGKQNRLHENALSEIPRRWSRRGA